MCLCVCLILRSSECLSVRPPDCPSVCLSVYIYVRLWSQEFLPKGIENTQFYKPGNNARENAQQDFLKQRWKDKYDG